MSDEYDSSEDGSIGGSSSGTPVEPHKKRFKVFKNLREYDDGDDDEHCDTCASLTCVMRNQMNADSKFTSAMIQHIPECEKNSQNRDNKQIELFSGGEVETEKTIDQEVVRKRVAYMIIVDGLPFNFVEGEGFQYFMSVACPYTSIPSTSTVIQDCYDLYLAEKDKLKSFINNACDRVCLSIDTWTSLQEVEYICLTSHFIDDRWRLNKRILNFFPINSHKGSVIGDVILKCLIDWGIHNVYTITVDSASSNDTTVAHVKKKICLWKKCILGGKWAHVRSIAHIISLIVQDGLDACSKPVNSVRAAAQYVKQSPARLNHFKEVALIEDIDYKKHLCLDEPARWNSTYFMLDTALGYARVFDSYSAKNYGMKECLESEDGPGLPSSKDWETVETLRYFLESFYHLTMQISDFKHVTSSDFLSHIGCLDALLKTWKNSEDREMSMMANFMIDKLEKHWGDITKMNKVIFIATAMDPRHKIQYVDFIVEKMYGKDKGATIGKETRQSMNEMFDDYERLYAASTEPSLPSFTTPISSHGDVQGGISLLEKTRARLKEEFEQQYPISEAEGKTELEKYLEERIEPNTPSFDLLTWWKDNSLRFPILSGMARDVLAVPISTESTFLTGGRVLDSFRSSLTPGILQSLICAQDWLLAGDSQMNVEENMDELDEFEEELVASGKTSDLIDKL